jgi:hypothetical protein
MQEDIQEINFAFYEPSEWLKIEPLIPFRITFSLHSEHLAGLTGYGKSFISFSNFLRLRVYSKVDNVAVNDILILSE